MELEKLASVVFGKKGRTFCFLLLVFNSFNAAVFLAYCRCFRTVRDCTLPRCCRSACQCLHSLSSWFTWQGKSRAMVDYTKGNGSETVKPARSALCRARSRSWLRSLGNHTTLNDLPMSAWCMTGVPCPAPGDRKHEHSCCQLAQDCSLWLHRGLGSVTSMSCSALAKMSLSQVND